VLRKNVSPLCEPLGVIRETSSVKALTDSVEVRRQRVTQQLDSRKRADLGQYLTPDGLAGFLASMFEPRDSPCTFLDPGAGVGSLSAAFVSRWKSESQLPLNITACEIDESLHCDLQATLNSCAYSGDVDVLLEKQDFIEWAALRVGGLLFSPSAQFTHILMNPPYKKIGRDSYEQRVLRLAGIRVPNLYAAFLALGVRLLAPGGQMVAITPRSFANGPYFKSFRRDLLAHGTLRKIHVYEERDVAFQDSAVLQENIVFLVERGAAKTGVQVTSSSVGSRMSKERLVPYDEVVHPNDSEHFIHLTPCDEDAQVASSISSLPETVGSLGLSVSTGRVVDFRSKDFLRDEYDESTVPLVYPTHLFGGGLRWPKVGKKPNALVNCAETQRLLLPAGSYVLVKRFSSKEERRRVVASRVNKGDLPGDHWAFENHLNVFHRVGEGMEDSLALGLVVWLNSTAVDTAFRQFSGHTQVNATDLRNMKYPTIAQLTSLGQRAGTSNLSQEKTDALVADLIFGRN
jgi:adenine-specific DNA-methyltransferase